MAVFDFADASLKGDRRWAAASKAAGYAPLVVLTQAIISIVQIVIGVVWIVSIQSRTSNLTFPQVIQPLIIPGLSFFNTIPSLHLHILARSNNPVMAIWFSSTMSILYLASAIIFLPPCAVSPWGGADTFDDQTYYAQTECPVGSRKGLWGGLVALQFVSALLYATVVAMAVKVRKYVKLAERAEKEGTVMIVLDEEALKAKTKREEEARRRWTEIRDL